MRWLLAACCCLLLPDATCRLPCAPLTEGASCSFPCLCTHARAGFCTKWRTPACRLARKESLRGRPLRARGVTDRPRSIRRTPRASTCGQPSPVPRTAAPCPASRSHGSRPCAFVMHWQVRLLHQQRRQLAVSGRIHGPLWVWVCCSCRLAADARCSLLRAVPLQLTTYADALTLGLDTSRGGGGGGGGGGNSMLPVYIGCARLHCCLCASCPSD